MLVAIALSSICLGAGALALQSISANSKRTTSIVEIDIGSTTNQNFYGNTESKIRTYMAPNFGKLMFAQEMREKLLEDAFRSTSVFCLPRSLPNSIRPAELSFPGGTGSRPKLDTPEAFRAFLAISEPTSTGIFTTVSRNVPPTSAPSTSIFLLGPSNDVDKIRVNAIYEIDFITPSNRPGVYASVRRYADSSLTHYYDVFYGPGSGDSFHPQFVEFEHNSRQALGESDLVPGTQIPRTNFQVAPETPFYILWLPDPSINPYKKNPWTAADPVDSPRAAYEHMSGKTSFTTVLPMFPPF